MEQIGENIQVLRKKHGITQAQLGEALSVSAQSVSKWENRQSLPDIALLPEIARYFGITLDELFGCRTDTMHYRERFVRFLVKNGILQFGHFPLRSGRISPYYIQTAGPRTFAQLAGLGAFYAECIGEHGIHPALLAGQTDREAPLLIAAGMELYNRCGRDIPYCIGSLPPAGSGTVLLKDTLTTGETLRPLLETGRISHVIVSVDRMERGMDSGEPASRMLERIYGVRIHAIAELDDILRALQNGLIPEGCTDELLAYRKQYGGI